jgi:hypothetical protein
VPGDAEARGQQVGMVSAPVRAAPRAAARASS